MADHTPTDETVLRQPAAPTDLRVFGWAPGGYQCFSCNDCGRAFEGDKRGFRCRACAEKLAASRSSDAQSGVTQQPAAPISPQEVAANLRLRGAHAVHDATRELLTTAADAIEALTAENAWLTSERDKHLALLSTMADMLTTATQGSHASLIRHERETYEQREQIGALKAEVEALKGRMELACAWVERGAVRAWNDTHYRTEPMSEDRKRVIETSDMFRQAMDLLDQGAPADHGWYSTHRAKVEADHAAATQAKRDAKRSEDDEALSAVAMSFLAESIGVDVEKQC